MGNRPPSAFSAEELASYEACTCLLGSEVNALYDKFQALGGRRPGATEPGTSTDSVEGGKVVGREGIKVKREKIESQEELQNNPFRVRLCQIFSSEEKFSDTWGDLSFDEYVDLYNCLSNRASEQVKLQISFRLYDFDNDGYLNPKDLYVVLETLSKPLGDNATPQRLLQPGEIQTIIDRVMRDCDVDGNKQLSFAEFRKVMSRIPNFQGNFSLRSISY